MASPLERCVGLLTELSAGKRRSTAELVAALARRGVPAVSQRQIQRDLGALERAGVPLQCERSGREQRWFISAGYAAVPAAAASHNEILALHTLKGMLGAFAHTRVGGDIDRLMKKLERHAPGNIFVGEEITADVSPGRHRSVIHDDILERIIHGIIHRTWSCIEYSSPRNPQGKSFVVSLCRCIWHSGRLYVAAWHPGYRHYITLAADRIVSVQNSMDYSHAPPPFDEQAYKQGRFGVHDGKVRSIRLGIKPHAVEFFSSRVWHPSQKFSTSRSGHCTLSFSAPLSPELVSWVVSWADAVTILAPTKLKDLCRDKVVSLFE